MHDIETDRVVVDRLVESCERLVVVPQPRTDGGDAEELRPLKSLTPPAGVAGLIRGQCFASTQMWPEAIAELRWADEHSATAGLAFLGYALARAGRTDEAAEIVADLLAGKRYSHGSARRATPRSDRWWQVRGPSPGSRAPARGGTRPPDEPGASPPYRIPWDPWRPPQSRTVRVRGRGPRGPRSTHSRACGLRDARSDLLERPCHYRTRCRQTLRDPRGEPSARASTSPSRSCRDEPGWSGPPPFALMVTPQYGESGRPALQRRDTIPTPTYRGPNFGPDPRLILLLLDSA